MQKLNNTLLTITLALIFTACNNQNSSTIEKPKVEAETKNSNESNTENQKELKGDFCFKKTENKDVTDIKFRILSNDDIRGEMIWQPYEKDGSVGTLTGKMISANEIKFMYSYTIEGNKQTEEKIMKVKNGILYIKHGELLDSKNNGNMTYKDISKATYSETIDAIKCE